MPKTTETLARTIEPIAYHNIPEPDIAKSRWILFDSIGCALGGYAVDRPKIALELAQELGGHPQATIIGGTKTSYALAAFVNAESINALDYDALGPLFPHICPQIVAPCLSIAERMGSSGKELLAAITLGHEVGGRAGNSVSWLHIAKDEPPYNEEAPRFSYTTSIFGAVAGVCNLLKFDSNHLANAMGIAGASTPIPAGAKFEHTLGPNHMTKYNCWVGWIAQLAVTAGLAAEKGFTGDTTILDGEWGYWKMYGSPFFKEENLLAGLGKVWHMSEVRFKPYPTCFANNTFIAGIMKLIAENGLNPDKIDSIVLKGNPLLMTENRVGTEVAGFPDTQFRVAFVAALVAYYGDKPSPNWQMPQVFRDPRILDLMKKVSVQVHPDADRLLSQQGKKKSFHFTNMIVEITTEGEKYSTEITIPKGHPENPMTEAELISKFRDNATYSLIPTSKVDRIIEMILNIEKLKDVRELTALLAIG